MIGAGTGGCNLGPVQYFGDSRPNSTAPLTNGAKLGGIASITNPNGSIKFVELLLQNRNKFIPPLSPMGSLLGHRPSVGL